MITVDSNPVQGLRGCIRRSVGGTPPPLTCNNMDHECMGGLLSEESRRVKGGMMTTSTYAFSVQRPNLTLTQTLTLALTLTQILTLNLNLIMPIVH